MNNKSKIHIVVSVFLELFSSSAIALNNFKPEFSLILDGHYKSSPSALSEGEKGFGLGHLELSVSSPVDDLFFSKFTGVLHQHDNKTEFEVEEGFFQTLSLPAGFTLRGGRFLSNVGYLNSQHTHADSFVDRPAVYRSFLGSHYYDDGVRLELLIPTDFYWSVGLEAFNGKKMRAENFNNPSAVGLFTAYTKVGGDIGVSQSWQAGLSYLHNRNGTSPPPPQNTHHELEHHSDSHNHHVHNHTHHHCHGAEYTGRHLYGIDATWKWAPQGNYKYQNVSLSGEYFRAQNNYEKSPGKNHHDGWYLSSVYQLDPQWATGLRYGEFNGSHLHDTQLETHKLNETELMLSWSHSHFSTLRLQYTHQKGEGLNHINNNIVTLQFIMSLGAHDAHQF